MTFGLKWRAKWWLRRQIMCRFHHCEGHEINSNMGVGWQCGTCDRIAHWVKWTETGRDGDGRADLQVQPAALTFLRSFFAPAAIIFRCM